MISTKFLHRRFSHTLFLKIYLFIGWTGSLLLHAGFLQLRQQELLCSCGVQAPHCDGFSCWRDQLQAPGFSSCCTWAQQLWHTTPWHIGSSQTRDPTGRSSQTRDPTGRSSQTRDPTGGSSRTRDPTGGSSRTRDPTGRSSRTRDPTSLPYIARWILNYQTAGEALAKHF